MRPLLPAALLTLVASCSVGPTPTPPAVVVAAPGAPFAEQLAAREVVRYVWLRTGALLPIVASLDAVPAGATALCIGPLASDTGALATEAVLLRTSRRDGHAILQLSGGSPRATLYAAYRFAEHLGVRFGLHGDVIPSQRVPFALPVLDELREPLFARRGIQPFHDFPEGPDWWDRDDYLAVLSQLPKLGMNFFGLHTYPEGGPNAEPLVWIGRDGEFGDDGTVTASYPASWQNTLRGNWGYARKSTSDFTHGTAVLFDRDAFGGEVMRDRCPEPSTPAGQNALFDDAAALLRAAVEHAHRLGIEVCIGTETPLTIPKAVQDRLRADGEDPQEPEVVRELYTAMFERIARSAPVDWYWLWTPEGWTWSGVDEAAVRRTLADLQAAVDALHAAGDPFRLATRGWGLGAPSDRPLFDKVLPKDVAVSCINRQVGMAPVEPGFAQVQGRGKWAIPWLEDDPALTQPQLWAGRMRADAADARAYGCDGLLGIHWRTRVLAMNVQALAAAAWDQDWPRAAATGIAPPSVDSVEGGLDASFPDHAIADTDDDALYRDVRYDVTAYRFALPDGRYRVVLKFCEPHYTAARQRVFGVAVQGRRVIEELDLFATAGKDHAYDVPCDDVEVRGGMLAIEFNRIVEFPSIAAIEIEGRADDGRAVRRRVNCGGPAVGDWAADLPASGPPPRGLPVDDFYAAWASAEFGPKAGPTLAGLFARLDGRLPRPADWTDGPGGIKPDGRTWEEVAPLYAFVDEFAAAADQVEGAAEQERFAYWLHTFRYLRAMAKVACARAEFARQPALPARITLVAAVREVYDSLLAIVGNPGELGTLANWEQHLLPVLLDQPGAELAKALGAPLPPDALLPRAYTGPPRVLVPTVRTMVREGEALSLRVLVLSEQAPSGAAVDVRTLDGATNLRLPLRHLTRGVYTVDVPAMDGTTVAFEYCVTVNWPNGRTAVFPATAPQVGQTVVVVPDP